MIRSLFENNKLLFNILVVFLQGAGKLSLSISKKSRIKSLISIVLILFFLCFFGLREIDSSKTTYLMTGAFALMSFLMNRIRIDKDKLRKENTRYQKTVLAVSASLFGLIVILANYAMYIELPMKFRIPVIILLFLASGTVFLHIFLFCNSYLNTVTIRREDASVKPIRWFFICFAALSAFYLLVFFLCSFPGQICSDSLNQIKQVISGEYSNHHPVYQTWIIGLFYKIGMSLFNDVNKAVAVYTVFQILFIASSFAFSLMTMIQAGCRKSFVTVCLLWYMFTPAHLIFSFTLWKDSMYGAIICFFTVAFFRILKKIGKYPVFNYILFAVSAVGFCLIRSNGLPAFILFLVIFAVITVVAIKRNSKNSSASDASAKGSKHGGHIIDAHLKNIFILSGCLFALGLSILLKFPVLKAMNIPQADTVEMLSIPVQQVTRIAIEKDDLTPTEIYVLEQIAPIDELKERYNPKVYDYARDVIRYDGHQEYIAEHPDICFNLWLSMVTRHPFIAAEAWVDQTSGYWNAGSYYWMKWWDGVCEEEGLHLIVYNQTADDLFHSYVKQFTEDNSVLILSYNVGLHVWIIGFLCAYCLFQRRKDCIYALPVLCLVATLLIATLMHDEFRFGYPVYTCLPIIVFAALGYKKLSTF